MGSLYMVVCMKRIIEDVYLGVCLSACVCALPCQAFFYTLGAMYVL